MKTANGRCCRTALPCHEQDKIRSGAGRTNPASAEPPPLKPTFLFADWLSESGPLKDRPRFTPTDCPHPPLNQVTVEPTSLFRQGPHPIRKPKFRHGLPGPDQLKYAAKLFRSRTAANGRSQFPDFAFAQQFRKPATKAAAVHQITAASALEQICIPIADRKYPELRHVSNPTIVNPMLKLGHTIFNKSIYILFYIEYSIFSSF